MTNTISRYTNKNVIPSDVEFSSQKKYAEALSRNVRLTAPSDINRPFPFREWYNRQTGLPTGQEYLKYNEYLASWYESRRNEGISTGIDTKNRYVEFLEMFGSIFDDMHIDTKNIDNIIDNIPEYTKKIKGILQYLIYKRESVKKSKLKYNMVGTAQSIERLFYEYILKAFTKSGDENEYTILSDRELVSEMPYLSACPNLQIIVEPYYDDTSYFDKDPTVKTVDYFEDTPEILEFLENNYDINDIDEFEWLYSTGFAQLCAENPLLWMVDDTLSQFEDGVPPLSAIESAAVRTLNEYNRVLLSEKYLSTEQYVLSSNGDTEEILDPLTPYANLTNRHYPTVASAPYIPGLYTIFESGGYSIPSNLGTSIAYSRDFKNELDTNSPYVIYKDLEVFTIDFGLTLKEQKTPAVLIDTDSTWLKTIFLEFAYSGNVKQPLLYQKFIPYQSFYESAGSYNKNGVLQQQDEYTEHDELFGKQVLKWQTDEFGNQYVIYDL